MKRDFRQLINTTRGHIEASELKVGDEVYGLDDGARITHKVELVGVFGQSNRFKTVEVNEKYFFAPDQSIYTVSKGKTRVVHAKDLKYLDYILGMDGNPIQITDIRITKHKDGFDRTLISINRRGFLRGIWDRLTGHKVNHSYVLNGILVHNASRYWVGGGSSANWSATGNTNWGSASNLQDNSSVPGSSDDIFFDGVGTGASNSTLSATTTVRSVNFTGYTNTWTHAAAAALNIGDATAGSGNIALKLVSGMTYTLGNAVTSTITFISTSATVQDVDFAGKTSGSVTFNATSNGSWKYVGGHTVGSTLGNVVTLTKGSLDLNGQTVSWATFNSNNTNTRSLTLGAASITLTTASQTVWATNNSTGFTFSGASATINMGASGQAFTPTTGQTYGTVNMTALSQVISGVCTITNFTTSGTGLTIGSAITVTNFTKNGSGNTIDILQLSGNFTITSTMVLAGTSTSNRFLVASTVAGAQRTITTTGVTHTWSNVEFQDINISAGFNASAQTDVGDCGGNSNITFPAGVTQTATMSTNKNWSDVTIWTTRVPLSQDNVSMAGVTGGTLSCNLPRLGKSIDWTGATGSPTWSFATTGNTIYGSITLISGMTISGTQILTLAGRSSYTLTSAGKQYTQALVFAAPSGTYTLNDAISTAGNLTVTNGGFVTSNFNVTCLTFLSTKSNTRTVTLGTSTITCTTTAATSSVNFGTTTNLTFSGASSTVVLSTTSTNVRTFTGGGLTWGTLQYNVAGSTGGLDIVGANSFDGIAFSDSSNARTLRFTAATTTTIRTAANWQVFGTSGKLMSISSITAATHTISCSSGIISSDYLSLTNSIATGGATFYAGANSTNVSGNTGWIFTAPVTNSSSSTMMMMGV